VQILADAKAGERPAPAGSLTQAPLSVSSAIAAHEPQAPVAPDNGLAPQATTLPAPVDSPEFAAAFGVQVSVFVREGVQHAELHLNPAETGPVSIAITLEGSQARVEFGADLAATRQAIENGLPALASALRDAGFTLAGGGVAQHSRSGGNGQGDDEAAGRGRPDRRAIRGGEAIVGQAVRRATHRVAVGGIDLYA
jgi:flagellar hook-length control protein FliK